MPMLLWLVLFGMAHQFLGHEGLKAVPAAKDVMFYLVALAIAGSIALSVNRKVDDGAIVAFHAATSCILFLILLLRFLPRDSIGVEPSGSRDARDLHRRVAAGVSGDLLAGHARRGGCRIAQGKSRTNDALEGASFTPWRPVRLHLWRWWSSIPST